MKTIGILLNSKNDSHQILGRYIKLQRTTSGSYSLWSTNILLKTEKSPKILLYSEAKNYLELRKEKVDP